MINNKEKFMHISLSESVYQILREQIITQQLKPGTRLLEENIAEDLNVSRTPVREALTMLAKDGLVKWIPRRGMFVIQLGRKDVEEVYDIRRALEGLAVELATPHIPDSDLEVMWETLKESEREFEAGNSRPFVESDTVFHDQICAASQNSRLIEQLSIIHDCILIFRTWEGAHYRPGTECAIKEHRKILDVLAKRDPQLARGEIEQHIEKVKRRLLEHYPFDEK